MITLEGNVKQVIVGSGPAALSAALTLRRLAPRDSITLISQEKQPFYSRVLISYLVAGRLPYDKLMLPGVDQLQGDGFRLLAGTRAESLDVRNRAVALSDGTEVSYDRLLLATGGSPALPPIAGVTLPGVFTLWTLEDALRLKHWAQQGQRAVVVGAGLVGLKAAEALLTRGLSVTVLELTDRVLPQLLDDPEATMVQDALEQNGLAVRTNSAVASIRRDAKATNLELANGTLVNCDLVVIATGIRANLDLARSAGAATARGILVDNLLQTSLPHVYSAGDVAEGWDLARSSPWSNPTWGNAVEQGRIAASNMAGCRKRYFGAVALTTFTFLGLSVAAVGISRQEAGIYRVESHKDPRTGHYTKLLMLGDRLVGAVAIGDITMAGVWRGIIARAYPQKMWINSPFLWINRPPCG